jgi:hypothetical protein
MCSTTSKLYLLERLGNNFIPVPMVLQNLYQINTENLTIEYGPGSIGLMDYYSKDPLYRGKFKVRFTSQDGTVMDYRDLDTTDAAFDIISEMIEREMSNG